MNNRVGLNRWRYIAFGLSIESSFRIPELFPSETNKSPDVTIETGVVPENLPDPAVRGFRYELKPDEYLLNVDNVARFLVSNGMRILIEPLAEGKERDIRLFLLTCVFGACLHQRKRMPLQASAVSLGEECVLLCGAPGIGKSTIAYALIKRGARLLSDGVSAIDFDGQNRAAVYPGYPRLKLWRDALEYFGIAEGCYQRVREGIQKYWLPMEDVYVDVATPVKRMFFLVLNYHLDLLYKPISGIEKFRRLNSRIQGREVFIDQGIKENYFNITSAMSETLPILEISRPFQQSTLSPIMERILEELQN